MNSTECSLVSNCALFNIFSNLLTQHAVSAEIEELRLETASTDFLIVRVLSGRLNYLRHLRPLLQSGSNSGF